MHMFRFWSSDSRGSDKTVVDASQPMSDHDHGTATTESANSPRPPKRRRYSGAEPPASLSPPETQPFAKRAKAEHDDALAQDNFAPRRSLVTSDIERAKEVIQYQFGLEILLKHDELRLINQELAKCQVALEQLRRCHLIPYPITCPTPEQMLEISSGKGAAVQARPGEAVPRWAAPFGVVDGPYARHYAKWLIPDPMFDGRMADWHALSDVARAKAGVDGRSMRNGFADGTGFGKRPVRGIAGQKLHALSSGYPAPKDKNGPCVLKRSDGMTVKLVCNDCHRENFSSTQGFINHCRIAHRKEFKSHEEAAVHCGHPIEPDEGGAGVGGDEKSSGSSGSSLVHPFARDEPITEQQTYSALLSRIDASLKLFYEGNLPNVTAIPGVSPGPISGKPATVSPTVFIGSSDTPYLSQLMQKRKLHGNFGDQVADAKTKVDFDDVLSLDEESEDSDQPSSRSGDSRVPNPPAVAARTPVVMRIPARTTAVPVPLIPNSRPVSSKGRSPHLAFKASHAGGIPSPTEMAEKEEEDSVLYEDDDMDVDLSPNTLTSNNAPSLVSDDGEYDDSDDGSTSDTSENMDAESVSDVAEIDLEDEHDVPGHETPRGIRHHRGSTGTAVKLRKDENKHVTFVTPVATGGGKRGRKPKV